MSRSSPRIQVFLFLNFGLFTLFACTHKPSAHSLTIDETGSTESIVQVLSIDSVWAGHPVGFCLYTIEDRQYIAYYNKMRNMVVGQRNLNEDNFELYILPPTFRETAGGTSTVLGWDSHNYVTNGIDKDGYIHLAGNTHVHPITYFKSTKPKDISTLVQEIELVGKNEERCTYPRFMETRFIISIPAKIEHGPEGLMIQTSGDHGKANEANIRYVLKWETLNRNRDLPRPEPWPLPSRLLLYKLKLLTFN